MFQNYFLWFMDVLMNMILITIGSYALTTAQILSFAAILVLFLLIMMLIIVLRMSGRAGNESVVSAERQREMDDKVAQMNQMQAELTGRMQTMAEVLGSRQADLTRAVADRLDAVRSSVGQGLDANTQRTVESLAKLNERLAVIDSAQGNLSNLANEVLALKDILSNKQARGAFGQGRMEAIIRDGLPASAYEFQLTLKNGKRPDCALKLPGDERPLIIDAKFPLEGFVALKEAGFDEGRNVALRRVRTDLGVHIKDISDKYMGTGETQDIAMLFVPSESLYAELCEHFDDIIQKAHKSRIIIVSPSLLMMAIQVCQAIVRDANMRDQARLIQTEVAKLLDDVRRLQERSSKLETHFSQAQKDLAELSTSADKVTRRGDRIVALEFEDAAPKIAGVQKITEVIVSDMRAAE
jgi:DNA recombination protein RmuC